MHPKLVMPWPRCAAVIILLSLLFWALIAAAGTAALTAILILALGLLLTVVADICFDW